MANHAIPFIALAALILGAQPALAQTRCDSVAAVTNTILMQYPLAHITGDYEAASVADLVGLFNSIPPLTAYKPDEVVIYERPDWLGRLVIIFDHGCQLAHVTFQHSDYISPLLTKAKPYRGLRS